MGSTRRSNIGLEDDLRPARGIGAGVVIGAALWILLLTVAWIIFR